MGELFLLLCDEFKVNSTNNTTVSRLETVLLFVRDSTKKKHIRKTWYTQSNCMSVIEISPLFSWPTWATACIIACLLDTFLWHIACPKWTLPVILHVGHWNKFSILMTNMSYSLYYCMSDWYIFVTYCMSEMDIAGFCACLCCTSLCFQTTYFGGMWQCLNTCSVLVQSATSWSESPEIESHTCVWLFFTDFV